MGRKAMTRATVFIAAFVVLPTAIGCTAYTDPPPDTTGCREGDKTSERVPPPQAKTRPAPAGKGARGVELGTTDERMAEFVAYFRKKGFPLTLGARQGSRYPCVIDRTADGCEAFTTVVVLAPDSDDRANRHRYELGGDSVSAYALPAAYNPHCKMAVFWPQVRCTSGADCPPRLLKLQADDSAFIAAFKAFRPRGR